MQLGTQTASGINHLYGRMTKDAPVPEVGMGATILSWTDRYAGTVVDVTNNGKMVVVQEDSAVRVDGNGMSEMQEYEYSADPEGRVYVFRMDKNGGWNEARLNGKTGRWNKVDGYGLILGFRRKYRDFSF